MEEFLKKDLGLYDTATGDTIFLYKAIDATHLCLKSKRCVIKYAKAKRGCIAQLCNWYESNKDMGSTLHYFIDEITPEIMSTDNVFDTRCFLMGVESQKLADFIYNNR